MRTLLCLLWVLLLITSCRPGYLTQEELIAYMSDEENGLKKSTVIGETRINVLFKPVDLLVAQEVAGESGDAVKVSNLREQYVKYFYFIVSLSKNYEEALNPADGGLDQHSNLLHTLSFQMNEYVTLTTNTSDTIPVGDFMLNRTFGLGEDTQLLFVFNREKAQGKEWVQFNLNEFGLGVGNQRFRFRIKDLLNVPTIKFVS